MNIMKKGLLPALAMLTLFLVYGCASLPPEVMERYKKARAILYTDMGEIEIRFFPEDAPNHVDNFIKLAKKGFYDGTTFHRIVPKFIIQGGDPNTRGEDLSSYGKGGPGYTIDEEFNDRSHKRGIVSMARQEDDENSAGSQFFIVLKDSPELDHKYTVFGEVVRGMDVVDKMQGIKRVPGKAIAIERVEMRVKIIE